MVELKLESVNEAGLIPKECFVSVRIGETQKLSRLAAQRTFRFPQGNPTDARRYGRIEVFQRIGACSLDVDPSNKGNREVKISCGDAGFGSLALTVGVEAEPNAPKPKEEPNDKAANKVKSAKQYLNKHGIEVQLSQAMQALLKEKPDNPAEFLATKLLGESGAIRLPPLQGAPQPPQPQSNIPTVGDRPPNRLEPLQSARKPASGTKGPEAVVPFRGSSSRSSVPTPEQYREMACRTFAMKCAARISRNFQDMPDSGMNQVRRGQPPYSQRPTPEQYREMACRTFAMKCAAGISRSIVPTPEQYREMACRTFAMKCSARISRQDSAAQTKLNAFQSQASAAQSKLNAFQSKPSVGTWLINLPKNTSKSTASTSGGPFEKKFVHQPSVGTWLSRPRPLKEVPESMNTRLKRFQFRPSVATWITHRLGPREEEKEKAATRIQAYHRGKKARASLVLPSQDKTWAKVPSIGTWLQARPPVPACVREKEKQAGKGSFTPHPLASAAGGLILGLPMSAIYPSSTCGGLRGFPAGR